MRPLTAEESKVFFEKLSHYIGDNVDVLINRPDGKYCFRLARERVYYAREDVMKKAGHFGREHLLSFGTCFGKFTHSSKFRLYITALDYLAPYAKHKVWVKPSAEQQYVYGHKVLKSGLGRITENTQQWQGVVVYNMKDLPLGFGVANQSTTACRHATPTTTVVLHQADIGEFIRDEEHLT